MGRFAVIGLGNFGSSVARVLYELGHEVVCLDENEHSVDQVQQYSTYSVVGAANDLRTLESLQIKEMDAVFLSLGEEISSSILVTLYLKDLGAKRIVVKIVSEDHGRILEKVGATETVFPEKDMAVNVAHHVSSPTVMNYLEISPDFSLQEVAPRNEFRGKTLAETRIRQDYGVNVIAIKDVLTDKISLNPAANYVIKDSDVLVVIGRREDLARFSKSS